jgi:micrococcal nuclease
MYQYKAKLVKVVDGDTIDAVIDCGFNTFKKERIRLYGINTPECRTRDKKEKEKGLAAKARLKELIKEGKNEFKIKTFVDKKGKFGRLLGELLPIHDRFMSVDVSNSNRAFGLPSELVKAVDNRSYNRILVDEGHAVEYHGGKK